MSNDIDPGIEGLTGFRPIGSGGFSTVYVAWEEAFSRWVAVKILDELDEAAGRRFARERSLMGRSSGHPNVITPIRFGLTADGKPYLVMQYMEGGSLQDVINRGEVVPWRHAVALIRPIAEALGDSHEAGILHKDVKPANILLARNGSPFLTDFGIASARDTTVTQMAFTFAHAPPETFANGVDARDERSDLYSLASTLYTIIAGRSPFQADGDDSQLALLTRIASHPVPAIGHDADLDRFMRWALAKDPSQRPQTARQFVDGLDRVVSGAGLGSVAGQPGSDPTVVAPSRVPEERPERPDRDASPDRWELPSDTARSDTHRQRTWIDALGWAVAVVAVAGVGAAAWFAFGRGPSDQDGDPSGVSTGEVLAPSTASSSSTSSPSSSGTDPAEVQQAKQLIQNPASDVVTLVMGRSVLPSTDISDSGFTFENCESQLVGLQNAFGGPDLGQLRVEIDRWPAGSPSGYDDPAGSDRGFRERLDAYVDQVELGYRTCNEDAVIAPVGTHVLSGWASIQSFLCVTGVVSQVTLADETTQTCPTTGEIELCARILAPQLDTFFEAFPDSKPDPTAACGAAVTNDQNLFAAL